MEYHFSEAKENRNCYSKIYEMKSASLNFHDSASTALIDDHHKTLLDRILLNAKIQFLENSWSRIGVI